MGTPPVRPSCRSTQRVSSSNRNALAEMLMPASLDQLSVRSHHLDHLGQRSAIDAATAGHRDSRPQPELRLGVTLLGVDVDRLAGTAFIGEKEVPDAIIAENDGHCP